MVRATTQLPRNVQPTNYDIEVVPNAEQMTFDGKVYAGSLPGRALSMVREWLALHRDELESDWALALQRKPLNPIEPLE